MGSRTALVGYDGSPQADRAITVAASLLPAMDAMVATVWHTPRPNRDLLQEVLQGHEEEYTAIDDLAARLREVGEAAASATAARGADQARDAGWSAQGVTRQSMQGVWFELAALAGETGAQIVVVGADGSVGPLGRVADALVRLSDRPVLVVREETPDPLPGAPLVIGYDGSAQAQQAIAAAASLFPGAGRWSFTRATSSLRRRALRPQPPPASRPRRCKPLSRRRASCGRKAPPGTGSRRSPTSTRPPRSSSARGVPVGRAASCWGA